MTPPDDYPLPEQRARERIDEMLVRAGWVVQQEAAHADAVSTIFSWVQRFRVATGARR